MLNTLLLIRCSLWDRIDPKENTHNESERDRQGSNKTEIDKDTGEKRKRQYSGTRSRAGSARDTVIAQAAVEFSRGARCGRAIVACSAQA